MYKLSNPVINSTVWFGEFVDEGNTAFGPYILAEHNAKISELRILNFIIQKDTIVKNASLSNSMLGNFVIFETKTTDLSIGDNNTILF